jgi:hypothetical protein
MAWVWPVLDTSLLRPGLKVAQLPLPDGPGLETGRSAARQRSPSKPEDLLAVGQIVQPGLGRPGVEDGTPFEREDTVGQGQHQVEVVLDDHHRDLAAQLVEHREQLLHHGRRTALDGFIEQQQPDIARERACHRGHLLVTTWPGPLPRVGARGSMGPVQQPIEKVHRPHLPALERQFESVDARIVGVRTQQRNAG